MNLFILPSLKTSGGIDYLLKIINDATLENKKIKLFVLSSKFSDRNVADDIEISFGSNYGIRNILFWLSLPIIVLKFLVFSKDCKIHIFSHYTTFFLSVFSKSNTIIVCQGLEWISLKPLMSKFLMHFCMFFYRRNNVVVASRTLEDFMLSNGIKILLCVPVWAAEEYEMQGKNETSKQNDFIAVVRSHNIKRPDLYCDFFSQAGIDNFNCLVVTPDKDIVKKIKQKAPSTKILFNPTQNELFEAYKNSSIILHFSDYEGFGLPPLEALGTGCIPICRDSGGIRNFMTGELERLILPLNASIDEIYSFSKNFLQSKEYIQYIEAAKTAFKIGLQNSVESRLYFIKNYLV